MIAGKPGTLPPLWRRLGLVIGAIALLSLSAAYCTSAYLLAANRDRAADDRGRDVAHGFAGELQARLQTADTLVQNLSSADFGGGGLPLRQRVLAAQPFRSLLLVPFKSGLQDERELDSGPSALPLLATSDRLKLASGQTLIRLLAPEEGRPGVYLLHLVTVGGAPHIGVFELAPAWLWQGAEQLPGPLSLLVVDTAERVVYHRSPVPPELGRMFAHVPVDEREPLKPVRRDWQQAGVPWRGAVLRFDPLSARLSGIPWNIVVYSRAGEMGSALRDSLEGLWPLLLLALVAVALATRYLTLRWQPVLARLDIAFGALGEGRFERIALDQAADTPLALAEKYNRSIATLGRRLESRARLAEIDRLLLEAPGLEGALEPILQRVCVLTDAHVASVALIDPDAPGHARSFMARADGEQSPVGRINLDADVTQALRDAPHGLVVQPHHLARYSFLERLGELGAEVCCVWPIITQNDVAAMLSIGYAAAQLPSEQARAYGAECASRLQIALSNQARDEQLYRQAHFDSLTSLPNRLLFRDRLSQELSTASDASNRGALLYVDLDHFKKINDAVGHIAGDQLLTIIAQRLRSSIKDGDTVARLGGDEFTVILRNLSSAESANSVAQRIIESLQRPVNVAGRDHKVRASIGITLFPDDGNSIEELLRNADLAMYQAKDSGRSRAVFFDRKMARAQLPQAESGLFRALRRREFALHYQPQYALGSGKLVGLEALLRWQSPREGLRFPNDFVPAAEHSGLIVDIGAWVLESACHQLAIWRDEGIAPARMALNVSVQQLRVAEFAKLVSQTLERTGLPPQMLELEVTESVFVEEEARATLKQLAALGVQLALDDFGTGYSSLNFLRQHPVHAIKIDRSFMLEVPDSAQACTLASTIIEMAHALGKQVVGEGIETMAQLNFLRERGCDIAQGFVLSRPLGVAEITALLSQRDASVVLLQRAAG